MFFLLLFDGVKVSTRSPCNSWTSPLTSVPLPASVWLWPSEEVSRVPPAGEEEDGGRAGGAGGLPGTSPHCTGGQHCQVAGRPAWPWLADLPGPDWEI